MKRAFLILLIVIGVGIGVLLLSRDKAELFANGNLVCPAPFGDLVAIQEKPNVWSILNSKKETLIKITCQSTPVWALAQERICCVTKDDKGVKALFLPEKKEQSFDLDSSFTPAFALSQGRVFLKQVRDEGIQGFAIFNPFQDSNPNLYPLDQAAQSLEASENGLRVSYTVKENDFFKLVVLKQSKDKTGYIKEEVIPEVGFEEHFWSPAGSYLLFASCDGGIEVFDFLKKQRRWVIEAGFSPCRILPYWVSFHGNGRMAYAEVEDRQGYRQITSLYMDSGKKSEKRFTTGWLDHYGPRLSRDKASRYLTYRQGELPSLEIPTEDIEEKESLYLFDFMNGDSRHLGNRAMKPGDYLTGPSFSGDLRFVYFADHGVIYRVSLQN